MKSYIMMSPTKSEKCDENNEVIFTIKASLPIAKAYFNNFKYLIQKCLLPYLSGSRHKE